MPILIRLDCSCRYSITPAARFYFLFLFGQKKKQKKAVANQYTAPDIASLVGAGRYWRSSYVEQLYKVHCESYLRHETAVSCYPPGHLV